MTAVSEVCGLSFVIITNGIKDLLEPHLDGNRISKSGGGRPSLASLDPALMEDVKPIVESTTIGKSESSVLCTVLSKRDFPKKLQSIGHSTGYRNVSKYSK
jgi:hypothetical protein